METRSRPAGLLIIALVLLGGFLNRVLADQETTYQHLRVFEEVVSLVMSNYVEPVKNERLMRGALQGLAEGLDADSAWLTPAQVVAVLSGGWLLGSRPFRAVGLWINTFPHL